MTINHLNMRRQKSSTKIPSLSKNFAENHDKALINFPTTKNPEDQVWPVYEQRVGKMPQIDQTNAKRLDNVRIKNLESQKRRAQIKLALQSHDKSADRKHIVFGDDEDDDLTSPLVTATSPFAVTCSTKRLLFGEGGAEQEDPVLNLVQDGIAVKPQFQGTKGEKLLKLSLKISHDKRFVLDEKFASSDDEETGDEGIDPTDEPYVGGRPDHVEDSTEHSTGTDQEMSVDQEMALYQRALQSATSYVHNNYSKELPTDAEGIEDYVPPTLSTTFSSHNFDSFNKNSTGPDSGSKPSKPPLTTGLALERFDPTRADHREKFEIRVVGGKKKPVDINKKSEHLLGSGEKDSRVIGGEKVPEEKVDTKDDSRTYYTVYRDLKCAFGSSTPETGAPFTLLATPTASLSSPLQPPSGDVIVDMSKSRHESSTRANMSGIGSLGSHFCDEDRFTQPTHTSSAKVFGTTGAVGERSDSCPGLAQNFFLPHSLFTDPTSPLSKSVANFCSGKDPIDPDTWELKRKELSHLFKTKRKRFLRHKSFSSRRNMGTGRRK